MRSGTLRKGLPAQWQFNIAFCMQRYKVPFLTNHTYMLRVDIGSHCPKPVSTYATNTDSSNYNITKLTIHNSTQGWMKLDNNEAMPPTDAVNQSTLDPLATSTQTSSAQRPQPCTTCIPTYLLTASDKCIHLLDLCK